MRSDPLDRALDRLRAAVERVTSEQSKVLEDFPRPTQNGAQAVGIRSIGQTDARTHGPSVIPPTIEPPINLGSDEAQPRSSTGPEPPPTPDEDQERASIWSYFVGWLKKHI